MNQPWYYSVSYFLLCFACVAVINQIYKMSFAEAMVVGIITCFAMDLIFDLYKAYKNG